MTSRVKLLQWLVEQVGTEKLEEAGYKVETSTPSELKMRVPKGDVLTFNDTPGGISPRRRTRFVS